MKQSRNCATLLLSFQKQLMQQEKSPATIEKYLRDIRQFYRFAANRKIEKSLILEYKNLLQTQYAVASVNSMLVSLNCYLRFLKKPAYCVRHLRIQRQIYRSEQKELNKTEYLRLVQAAKVGKNQRLYLLLQTICATGIRVSELQCITVQAAHVGQAVVTCKGKTRIVFCRYACKKACSVMQKNDKSPKVRCLLQEVDSR